MSFNSARDQDCGKLYKGHTIKADHSDGDRAQGKTLCAGSSHLVPLEMVIDPPQCEPAW